MLQPYLILAFTSFLAMAGGPDTQWRGFRGNDGLGVADGFPTLTNWNAEEGTNIQWKIPIPGMAHASPIIEIVSGKEQEIASESLAVLAWAILPIVVGMAYSTQRPCVVPPIFTRPF